MEIDEELNEWQRSKKRKIVQTNEETLIEGIERIEGKALKVLLVRGQKFPDAKMFGFFQKEKKKRG